MICQDVWDSEAISILVLSQGITDVPVERVERWHSEFEDIDSPWVEWRIYDIRGRRRVTWRVRGAT